MASSIEEQKRIELWYLNAARKAGVPIPPGEIHRDAPDFRFQGESGALGVELSELLRPASSNHGLLPVQEESVHREILESAQRGYYAATNARPVHVSANFANTRGKKHDKREIARRLTEFIQLNAQLANPAKVFMRGDAPEGFDSVLIQAEPNPRDWWFGASGGVHLSDIRPQVEARIAAKDKFVPTYRKNLPVGAGVWLLLYTGVTVPRSVPIPHGVEAWRIPFRFDRVFWFAELEGEFAEIRRAESAAGTPWDNGA